MYVGVRTLLHGAFELPEEEYNAMLQHVRAMLGDGNRGISGQLLGTFGVVFPFFLLLGAPSTHVLFSDTSQPDVRDRLNSPLW